MKRNVKVVQGKLFNLPSYDPELCLFASHVHSMNFRRVCTLLFYPLWEKLQLDEQKLHHQIRHLPSTSEDSKDNTDNTAPRSSMICNLVKYLLVAAKQGQGGATVDVEIQAATVDTHVMYSEIWNGYVIRIWSFWQASLSFDKRLFLPKSSHTTLLVHSLRIISWVQTLGQNQMLNPIWYPTPLLLPMRGHTLGLPLFHQCMLQPEKISTCKLIKHRLHLSLLELWTEREESGYIDLS